MAPVVKLAYFPLRARAELIRLILNAGAIDYTEENFTFEQWPAKKPSEWRIVVFCHFLIVAFSTEITSKTS